MDVATLGSRKTRSLVAQAERLPLVPTVLMRVLGLDPGSERYFECLLVASEQDPTFAVRLIRLANAPASAPASAPSKPIVTIRQAVVRLGARECAGLATAVAVARGFVPGTAAYRNLWLHSVQAAVGERTITGLMLGASVSPEHASSSRRTVNLEILLPSQGS
jgi:HD-like signal output (HDOD) protein